MEVMNEQTYIDFLLKLLNKEENIIQLENQKSLELNIYLTLLSLSNLKYNESFYIEEVNIVEDFLRKVNNLKVKIQLKRKEKEIEKLLAEIKEIYRNNLKTISKYNKDDIDIDSILNSNNDKELTILIDKLTKEKMKKLETKEEYDILRKKISECIFDSNYYIENDILYIETNNIELNKIKLNNIEPNNIELNNESEKIELPLYTFYEIFEYLLNINMYEKVFPNNQSNILHTTLIEDIINLLSSKESINNQIIPIVLTYLISKEFNNYQEVDTSSFSIDNIKITDLYSLAENNNQVDNNKTAKWKKILIPNEYLYKKIKEITTKGMYYFKEDKFILENIDNSVSDFKISIPIDKMLDFLKENLQS